MIAQNEVNMHGELVSLMIIAQSYIRIVQGGI